MTPSAHLPPVPLRPRRPITGYSAMLLPFSADGSVDWEAFCAHLARTAAAGLIPAVNMDTGYVNLIDAATRREVLRQTRQTLGSRPFAAGAYVASQPGDRFEAGQYDQELQLIQQWGGLPVILQSFGLTELNPDVLLQAYANFGKSAAQYLAFELGSMFAPFGRIYSRETYAGLLGIPACIGAKHSSLSRRLEWERLALRDQLRPEFQVLTGNDLAIDMVMYGSDYLLGLSTFAPDYFRLRDRYWEAGDARFYELNDALQYLGQLAFRDPVPAYKHSAAQFLALRGWLATDATHPRSPQRPATDRALLQELLDRLPAAAGREPTL